MNTFRHRFICLSLGLLTVPLLSAQDFNPSTIPTPGSAVNNKVVAASDASFVGSNLGVNGVGANPQTPFFGHAGNALDQQPATSKDGAALNPVGMGSDAKFLRAVTAPDAPTQFELFVQNATSQRLPIYGSQLFKAAQTFTPITSATAPANYVLAPGDEIQLQVWGASSLDIQLTVDRQGQVMVPRVGPLSVVGVKAEQLGAVFKAHLSKVLVNVEVAAHVSKLRSIQVYVVGQARQPGTYTLNSLSTLVNALFASGGPSATGSMRHIQLKRGGKTVATLDLYDFIAQGNAETDVALQAGDVIVIPPVGPRVAIAGAYDHAAIYELKAGENTLHDVLAKGGGLPTLASNQKAVLERVTPQADAPRQVADIVLNAIGMATPLQDGDIVSLLKLSPAFSNAVTLQGNVAMPLRHPHTEQMRISDLIPEVEALITHDYYTRKNRRTQAIEPAQQPNARDVSRQPLQNKNFYPEILGRGEGRDDYASAYSSPQSGRQALQTTETKESQSVGGVVEQIRTSFDSINWDYAVIERLDRKTLVNQLIPFNLGKAVLQHDPVHNLPLQPGDVVTVFNVKDMQLPAEKRLRLVRLEGEVTAPGVYPLEAGETLPQLLRRIGGLTSQAYVFGIEFTRESVRKQQQQNLDKLVSRLEQALDANTNAGLANAGNTATSQAAIGLQLRKETQQRQLAQLRNLRSSGRVALELPVNAQGLAALPPLPLEDGDRVLVPSTPSFVAAFGSVTNENVLVYRPQRTVADVLRLTVPTSDADLEQTFVLRADGTVVGQNSYNSWFFSSNLENLPLMPGDTVVVPAKTQVVSTWDKSLGYAKDITQIFSNLGLGLAAIRSIQNN